MMKTNFTLREIRDFINRAESQWLIAYESSQSGQSIFIRGDEYRKFPTRFNTRAKLLRYFRINWSLQLSAIMLCNLNPITFRGSLYEIVADPGPVPDRVVRLRILSQTSNRIRVRAVMFGGNGENTTIFYTISTASGRLRIIARSGRLTDYRYLPCPR